jgi:hypothetical protein
MSQPANTDILVKQRVRSYRQMIRHESVLAITGGMRPQVMSVPGEETLHVTTYASGSNVLDTSLVESRSTGLPVVRGLRTPTTFAAAVAGIADIDFPVTIGKDRFLQKNDANVADDLHTDLRAV